VKQLWGFQEEDVSKLEHEPEALLLWGMGTGKTTAGVERDRRIRLHKRPSTPSALPQGPVMTLVVAGKATHDHWAEEIHDRFITARIFQVQEDRDAFLLQLKTGVSGFYLLNWELLRLPTPNTSRKNWAGNELYPVLTRTRFLHVVADEVHHAQNRKSQQAKVLKKIKTEFKTGMTGTLIINQPPGAWSVFNWLRPKEFTSYWRFYDRYSNWIPAMRSNAGATSVQYRTYLGPKNTEELRGRIQPFTVLRRKADVLTELPDRYYTTMRVDLAPRQRKAYDSMRRDMVAWIGPDDQTPLVATSTVAKLQRLQQFAIAHAEIDPRGSVVLSEPSAKIDALEELIRENPDEQFVVFSQFRGAVYLAAARLSNADIPCSVFTGDTPSDGRRAALDQFIHGSNRIFLATIGAGGEGIDGLQCAWNVVFLDRSWSPAENDQAESRLHRAGQAEAVQVIDIVARNTVDQGKDTKLELKRSWVRQTLGAD
jgi:SNF2 family DNA or RNA helicase